MWYIYTIQCYPAIKMKEIGSSVETWMALETVIQSKVIKTNTVSHIKADMWDLEKRYS